ncbi:MAG: hypothetical protein FJY29_11315 [Betaproteobacteria bacterium]|nr:hypothetical protein [Betaproteobacteria bacterium]
MPGSLSPLRVKRTGTALSPWLRAALLISATCAVSPISGATELKSTAGNKTQCRSLGLFNSSAKSAQSQEAIITAVLDKFERAFSQNDADLFADVASDSLQKKKDDYKAIFNGTVLEYGLKKVKLQRSSLWEIKIEGEPQPGQTATCGDVGIQPVFGPTEQFAALYSVFAADQQTRILVIFARTPQDAKKVGGLGLVLLQVQRWTYNGRSPEAILSEGLRSDGAGESLIGYLLSEASARILESNPYMILPLQQRAREQTQRLSEKALALQAIALRQVQSEPIWKPERFATIFKDGELAVGVKVRMTQEIALNDQLKKCKALGKQLFSTNSAWRKSFSGFECLPYGANEEIASFPKGGSQYFPWTLLDSNK